MLGSTAEPPRVAFSVGRSVGDAVTRNRVRRQLRAALREHAAELRAGRGLSRARHARRGRHQPYAELSDTLRAILGELSGGKP